LNRAYGRQRICKIPANGGSIIPLPNDNFKLSHGPFADPNGEVVLVHAIKEGEFHGIWEIPLDGEPPRSLMPPGFEKVHNGHATRAANGIITFDALRFAR
jgi:hypothetical protein